MTLFHLINTGWSNALFDIIMPMVRSKYIWMPLYTFISAFLFFNYRNHGWKFLILLIVVVAISDSVSSQLIKKNVERMRPCNNTEVLVIERVDCGSGYSFTSSHAANHFAIATMLIFGMVRRRWLKWAVIAWASIVCLAQIYVGVHYPLDVIGGALLGVCIAWGTFELSTRWGWTLSD